MSRLATLGFSSATGAAAKSYRTLVKVTLFATVVLSGEAASTAAFAQTNDYVQERCAQLIAYYDYYGGGSRPSESTDGARNHTRISASIDCERGNYEAGIKTIEALMTRKHMPVPRPDVASTPTGVRPIDPARIPRDQIDQAGQPSTR